MASAKYYKDQYQYYRDRANEYEDYMEKVEDIQDNISNHIPDEIDAVNKKIDELIGALQGGVRHSQTYSGNIDAVKGKKESRYYDAHMSEIETCLKNEKAALDQERRDANSDKNYYYQEWQEAKERERKEKEDALKETLGVIFNFIG